MKFPPLGKGMPTLDTPRGSVKDISHGHWCGELHQSLLNNRFFLIAL